MRFPGFFFNPASQTEAPTRPWARTLVGAAGFAFSTAIAFAGPADILLKTDADFCQLSLRKGMSEAFLTYMAEDGAMLSPGEPPVIGKAAIAQSLKGTEKIELTWKPLKADLAASGDLGYTYGTYRMSRPGKDGSPVVATGKYMTVWRKQANGSWKAAADIGNQDPAPAPAG